jgi:large repetitive protein
MRRIMALAASLIAVLTVMVPGVQFLSTTAAQAVASGSVGAAAASSWQTNATVWKMAYASGDIFMVGDFTSMRPPGAALGTSEHAISYFAALNASTGALDTTKPAHTFTSAGLPLTDGAITASPDGKTIYVGGSFTAVDGVGRNHIAAFNAATGALLSWNPNVSGRVSAIATAGNTVYIGGTFGKVGTTVEGNLAAVSASTPATVFANFKPTTNNTVDALAATPDDTQVVVGGYFDKLNGLSASADGTTPYNKAAILGGEASTTPGQPQPMPADTAIPVGTTANNPNGCISNVKYIVIAGGAAYIANEGTGGGCFDGTWAVNLNDGSLKWQNQCLGATQIVTVVGNYLYKGSHAHDCVSRNVNGDPDNYPQVPENQARHLLSQNISNGFLGPWYPFSNAGPNLGPRAMATDGTQLYVGGDFTKMNNVGQQGIARFTPTSDYTTPKPAAPVAVSSTAGAINVYAQAPVDLDDTNLTMELFRDGGTTPIATTAVHSLFWKQPVVGWADTGLATGSSHSYTVKAIDTDGTGGSVVSSASKKVVVTNGSTGYAATVLGDNPAAYWRFGEASGNVGADSSPNLLGGAFSGTVTHGALGAINDSDTAATLDGATGYFSSGASEPSPSTFSAEAWFKTTSTTGGKIIGFGSNQTGDSSSYDKQIYMTNDGHLIFGTFNGGTDIAVSTKTYNDGVYHQVVGTQGASGMALYVDGKKIASNPVTTNQSYTGFWRVGEDNLNGWPGQPSSNFFNGSIDDVSVYHHAISAASVAAQFTAAGGILTAPRGSTDKYAKTITADSPNLYWRLDDAAGSTTASDLSGNGNDGTYNTGDTLGVDGAISDGTTPPDSAMTTNGSDDTSRMVGTTELASPSTFSVEAWFKTATPVGKIVGFGDSGTAANSSKSTSTVTAR